MMLAKWKKDKYIWLLLSPVLVYYAVFHYAPMYGVIIAFKEYSPVKGIWGSPWVGLEWFQEFFNSVYFGRLLLNTLKLSLYGILWGFPVPILFALLLNELKQGMFKKVVQTVSYLPHFISIVVICGLVVSFVSPTTGIVNELLKQFGFAPIHFLAEPEWFRTVYIGSGIWQSFGWNSIIFIAAIASINPELYEAAVTDGASRWEKMRYITLPGIFPTIMILLMLNFGSLLSVGFEKIILLYNPSTYETADVISTYVYRKGLLDSDFSFAAAVSLFNSVINFMLLVLFNRLSRKVTEVSLW
ncbi:ABC transporter permease [Paenibacillus contaminans]|uniref:Sugar ABC transporter permease n=1 Tax=Paenibacillus contaminans TaxID=450362 RepID=A0A329M645_9BACL|nr:ABC transporter permease subunit [Paenibacillus contaminans]RAV12457.1 sugar ABC transporter permease [Paenibacillus contaminans]